VPWEPQPEQTSSSVCERERQRQRDSGTAGRTLRAGKEIKENCRRYTQTKALCARVYAERFLVTWEGVNIFCGEPTQTLSFIFF
jgi:hypothetical protein